MRVQTSGGTVSLSAEQYAAASALVDVILWAKSEMLEHAAKAQPAPARAAAPAGGHAAAASPAPATQTRRKLTAPLQIDLVDRDVAGHARVFIVKQAGNE